MDGFKILDQKDIIMFKPATYFILIGLAILVIIIATIINKYCSFKKEAYIALACFSLLLIIVTVAWGTIEGKKEYKVTPIEYKYHLDTNKYIIYKVEGDIWTLKER